MSKITKKSVTPKVFWASHLINSCMCFLIFQICQKNFIDVGRFVNPKSIVLTIAGRIPEKARGKVFLTHKGRCLLSRSALTILSEGDLPVFSVKMNAAADILKQVAEIKAEELKFAADEKDIAPCQNFPKIIYGS